MPTGTCHVVLTTKPTNEFGAYEIAGLKPGTFRVKVDLEGFQSFVADDLLIDPGTVRRLDVRLQLGTASAEVNVVAGAAVIQTDTGEITAQVERKCRWWTSIPHL